MSAPTSTSDASNDHYHCVIAGGGPAGLMLGLLFARKGLKVAVVERYDDFRRDFRGDTIHPSTMQVMDQIGLLAELLALPHTKAPKLYAEVDGKEVCIADFTKLRVPAPYIAFMPQWDFLKFLADQAQRHPNFDLLMGSSVRDLIWRDGEVRGVEIETCQGLRKIEADLVVAADGRRSQLRKLADLPVETFGSPRDVVWFQVPRQLGDPDIGMTHAGPGQGLVLIDRGPFWQCGYSVAKGSFKEVADGGLEAFRRTIEAAAPFLASRLDALERTDLHLLRVRIDRLSKWWVPGLLFIGDAAHAMSPIGGVGVNLAIQDAVAAANILGARLLVGNVRERDLKRVQKRRMLPTKALQRLQVMMQGRGEKQRASTPLSAFMRAMAKRLPLQHVAGRIIGVGIRSEHVARIRSP